MMDPTELDFRLAAEALDKAAKLADAADVIGREYYGLKPTNDGVSLRRVAEFCREQKCGKTTP